MFGSGPVEFTVTGRLVESGQTQVNNFQDLRLDLEFRNDLILDLNITDLTFQLLTCDQLV